MFQDGVCIWGCFVFQLKWLFLILSVDDSLLDDLNSEGQRSDQASWIKTDHCTGSALLSPFKTCVEFNFNGWHCWLDSLCRKPWDLEAHHRWLGVAFALFLDHKGRVCVYVCVQSSSAGDLKGFFDSVWLLTVRTWNISFVADVHMCLWVCVYVWVSVECVIISWVSERNARLFLMLINVCQNRVTMFDCGAYGPDSYMHLLQAAGWCPESKSFERSKI